jgi:glucose-6-phosphate 1-dehydrogenase
MPGSKKVPGRALWYPISLWLMLNPFVLEDWGKFLEHADGGAVKLPAKPLVGRSASPAVCDALVFFGATGDLAYKKIFPALHNMIQHKTLNVPVIGVAKAGWTLDQLRERAAASIKEYGAPVDGLFFRRLVELMQYIDGDYQDPAAFARLRKVLGGATHPAHYLAIPPVLFSTVVEGLGRSGCVG